MTIGLIMLAPFALALLVVIGYRVHAWREHRRYLTIVAWHHYATRRRWFESDETLQERCRAVVRSLR